MAFVEEGEGSVVPGTGEVGQALVAKLLELSRARRVMANVRQS